MRQRIGLLAVALGMVLSISACGGSSSSGSNAKTYSYKTDWGTFTISQDVANRIQQKISSGKPLDIPLFDIVTGGDFPDAARLAAAQEGPKLGVSSQLIGPVSASDSTVINDIESYLSRHPDAIAINPGTPDAYIGEVNKVAAMGIPVIAWNSDIPKSKRVAFIGPDNVKFGADLGQLMVNGLKAKGVTKGTIQIFCVSCTSTYAVDGRIPGFEKAVSAALPDIKYAEPVTLGADVNAAVAKVDAALRGKTDVVGLYTTDEFVSASAVWVQQNGGLATKSKYVIVGHNLGKDLLQLMVAGYIDGLSGQDPYGQVVQVLTWLKTFLTTGNATCGPICITPLKDVTTAQQAQQLLSSNCSGQGCA